MKDKRIIVLGGSGFLGQSIIARLKHQGYINVYIGDIQKPKGELGSLFLFCDLLDYNSIEQTLLDFDLLINCTGQITKPINTCYSLNTEGVANLVKFLEKHSEKKLIQISTVSVYGSSEKVSERSPLNPETPYATSKAFAEFILGKRLGKKHAVLRIPNLYGQGQEKGILAYLRRSLLGDRKLEFNNNGDLARHYLHIDDCSFAIISAIENDISGVFNIPVTEKMTVVQLIDLFEKKFNIKFDVFLENTLPFENIYDIDYSKFQSMTGFIPQITIENYLNTFTHGIK